jgi:hypothetical protein
MTVDPRVARLRSLDTEATPGPWAVSPRDRNLVLPKAWADDKGGPFPRPPFVAIHATRDAALIAAMRNAFPAMVTLLESVLDRHVSIEREPTDDDPRTWVCAECSWGGEQLPPERCVDANAALAVLDTLDPP